jgi:hypothetical protein
MNQTVVVEYKTRKDYCQCCDQKLPNPKVSEIREFEFNKENLKSWTDWKEVAEFEEDLKDIVIEYVCETIRFFAMSSDDRLLIGDSEFDKVRKFILEVVKENGD